MEDIAHNSKRIAKNTILLYIRQLIVTLISLFTSRVVLDSLGVNDFGIYNVVGGLVAMFAIVTGSLSASISRFITFELGSGDKEKLSKIFSTSIHIQFILIAIVVLLMETIGLWFLNCKMVIPADRMVAANWVFQISVVTFTVNLWSIPYNADIIAHEHMNFFAYIGILESISMLVVAIIISYNPFDRLVYYAVLLMFVKILVRIVYGIYCKKNFEETVYHPFFEKNLLKEMLGFAGWNFIGASAGVCREQGVNILINLFYGTAVNAARGLSVQVNNAVSSFATNFMTAMNPQLIKSYASRDYDYMNKLLFKGTKFSYYLLFLLSIPVLVETQTLLSLWLKDVPHYSLEFVRLILVFALCEVISTPMVTVMLATGDIKKYQIIVGTTNLLNLPVSYLLLKFNGFSSFPQITMLVTIVLSIVCLVERLVLMKEMINLDVKGFIIRVIIPIIAVSIVALLLPIAVSMMTGPSLWSSIGNMFLSVISAAICILFIGLSTSERNMLLKQISSYIIKQRNVQ